MMATAAPDSVGLSASDTVTPGDTGTTAFSK